jgi:hypothetical protein
LDARILIVGGYGIFGGRLVELLEDEPRLTLLVAGRSLSRAKEYCASRARRAATLVPVQFDRESVDPDPLRALRPTLVVDASGPFQQYGEAAYRLIRHCIDCGVSYLDLADGADFVAGVAQFDAAAREAGVVVLTGVSSFPVLTAAVVRRLSADMTEVCAIHGGIAPSPYAGVGLNVIRAIATYAGQCIPLRRAGRTATGRPFTESLHFTIAAPGHVPLERKRFSLVEVPDLLALAQLWPSATDIWMGAAPVPATLHRALTMFAWLVRLRVMPSLHWMARAMHSVTNRVRWGEHRGGMFVTVRGRGAHGEPVVREWHLLAEGNDGPLIPSMAVEALVRKALDGKWPAAGARAATTDIELTDYEHLFSRRTIFTGVRERELASDRPMYQQVLGDAWHRLAPEIRQLHTVAEDSSFEGHCKVERGRNPLAWLVAALYGFPSAGADQPIRVDLKFVGGGEIWTRTIGGRRFSSVQTAGRGRSEWLVRERFGPMSADLALVVEGAGLRYVIRRWRLFGIPLPLALGPRSTAFEMVEGGKFRFDVQIGHPLTGRIVRYRGELTPAPAALTRKNGAVASPIE